MYFEIEMLCLEWIACEFQGAFLPSGFKIRYAFPVRLRESVRCPKAWPLSSKDES